MKARSAEDTIRAAKRINEFITDEVVAEALGEMKWQCYNDFVKAKSNEERIQAQARAQNLENFATEMEIIRSSGERLMLDIAARDRKEKLK